MGSSKKLEIANAEKKGETAQRGNKALLGFMYSKSIRSESSRKTKSSPKSLVNKMGLPDEDEVLLSDPKYKSYAAQIDKCLKSFEYSTEWPDLISALSKLNKVIGSCKQKVVPKKFLVSKRLSQCLHPALPAGVHLKALEAYDLVFTSLGPSGLAVNLHIFSPGLFPLYPHALIGVRSPLLSLYERHFLPLGIALRPALEGFLISILSGMEEGSDFYERARDLIERVGEENELEPLLWIIAERVKSARLAALRLLLHRSSRLTMGPVERTALLTTLRDEELLTARVSLELISLLFPLDGLASEEAKVELLSSALALLLRRDLSLNRRFFGWLLGDKEGFFPNVSRGLLLKAARSSLHTDPNAFRILTYLMDKEEVDVGEELLPDVVRQMAKNETPKDAAGLFFSTFPHDFLTHFAGLLLIGNNNDEPDEGKKTFNQKEDDAVELVDFLLTKDLLCPRRLFNLLVDLPPQPKFVTLFERLFRLAPSPLDFSGFPSYYSKFVGKALGKEVKEIFSTLETKGPDPLEEDFNFNTERDRPYLNDGAEELKVDPLLASLVPILNEGVLVSGEGENLRPLAALCLARHKNSLSTFLSSPSDPLLILYLRNNTHFFEKVTRWLWERAEVELLQGLHAVSPVEVERVVGSRRDTRRLKVLLNAGRGMPKGTSNFDRAIFHVINDDSVDAREFVKDTLNLQDGALLFDPPLFALLNNLGKSEPIIQTPNDNLSVHHIGWDEGGGGDGKTADVYDSVSVSELDLRVNYSRGELSSSFPPSTSPTRRMHASCEALQNTVNEDMLNAEDLVDRAVSLHLPLRVPYPEGIDKIPVREIPSPTNVSSSYSSGTDERPKPIHPFHTHLRTYLMSYDEALVLHGLDGLEKLMKFQQTASALVQTKLEHSPRGDCFDKSFPSDFIIGAKSKSYAQVFLEILINLGITYYGTENSINEENREANFQVQVKAWSLAADILEQMEAQHACILGSPLERRTLLSLIAILEFDPNNVETWTEEILAASPHNYETIHEQLLRLTTILVKADRKPKGPANHDVLKFLPGLALSSQPLYLKAVSSGLSGVRWTVWGLWLDSLAAILPHLGADLSPVIIPSIIAVGNALVGPPPSEDFPERAILFLANVTRFLLGHMEEAAVKASSFYSLIFSSGTAKTPTAESDDPRALAKADFFGKFHILLMRLATLDAYTTERVKSRIREYLSPVVESHTDKFVWSLCLVEGDPSNLLADLLQLEKFTASLNGLLKNLNKVQQESGLDLIRELVERQEEKVECVPQILALIREMNAGGQALNTAPPAVRLLTQLVVHVGSGKTELKEFQEVVSKVLETLSRKGGDVKVLTEHLDLVNSWGSEEKEKLLPLLASVVYNLTPNMKKGGEVQKATARFFERLSNFSYTRKAWKKELFEHLVDSSFFKIDVESLRIWNTTLENLFSQDSTFLELIARVNVSVTTLNYFSSKEVEWESRASLIKRLAYVIFASRKDTFVKFVQNITERLAEALKTQVPLIQSAVFLCFRVLLLRFSPNHLQALWPIIVFEVLQILSMDADLFERGGESRALYLSVEKLLCLCEALPPHSLPIFQMYRWAFVSRRRFLDPGPDPADDLEADFLENP